LGDDLVYFFVAERRAKDVHADVGGDRPQPSHISSEKAPLLHFLEEAFESARGERCRDALSIRQGAKYQPRKTRLFLSALMTDALMAMRDLRPLAGRTCI
jgi:hypothetical protein